MWDSLLTLVTDDGSVGTLNDREGQIKNYIQETPGQIELAYTWLLLRNFSSLKLFTYMVYTT